MVWYLHSDATCLSDKDIQDIINARNSMKRASEVMANKYKISSRRVYQIWRGAHPPIDPAEGITSGGKGTQNQVKKTEEKKTKSTHTSESSQFQSAQKGEEISPTRGVIGDTNSKSTGTTSNDQTLNALHEKVTRRSEKNKINGARLLNLQ